MVWGILLDVLRMLTLNRAGVLKAIGETMFLGIVRFKKFHDIMDICTVYSQKQATDV